MLEHTLIFVDTSYLLASFYNSWEIGARGQLEIDLREVVNVLSRMINQQLNQPVQRQLWCDGIPESGPHHYQRSLHMIDGIQLCAGQLIEWDDQRTRKAVDMRLIADMVVAGLRNQVSDIVLISDDTDMLPGVAEASAASVRVHLCGSDQDSMSGALRHTCDSTAILNPREDFADAMRLNVLEDPVPPAVRTSKPLGGAEPIEGLGATYVPDTRITPPGEDSLDSGTENTLSAADGDVASPEADTPEVPQDQRVVPFPTAGCDSDCHGEDNAAATPTTKANSPKFNEVEHATKMDAREIPTQAEYRAGVERTGDSETTRMDSAVSGVLAASPTQQTQRTQPAQPSPATMPGATGNTDGGAGNGTVNSTGAGNVDASVFGSASSTATDSGESATEPSASGDGANTNTPKPNPRPNPSMMTPGGELRSRYVPLSNEVWTSTGFQTPFDVGQQYANWWYGSIANEQARDSAHLLSGGGLPPDVDRPLLQFVCETLHEYTLTETQCVNLRDGFHAGIHGVLLTRKNGELEKQRASRPLQFRRLQRCR